MYVIDDTLINGLHKIDTILISASQLKLNVAIFNQTINVNPILECTLIVIYIWSIVAG